MQDYELAFRVRFVSVPCVEVSGQGRVSIPLPTETCFGNIPSDLSFPFSFEELVNEGFKSGSQPGQLQSNSSADTVLNVSANLLNCLIGLIELREHLLHQLVLRILYSPSTAFAWLSHKELRRRILTDDYLIESLHIESVADLWAMLGASSDVAAKAVSDFMEQLPNNL